MRFRGGNDHAVFLFNLGKKKYVIKQYRFRTKETVEDEAKFIDFLYKNGCSVPKIFPLAPKGDFSFVWNKRPAIIMSYLDGNLLLNQRIDSRLIEQIGERLGYLDKNSFSYRTDDKKETGLLNDPLLFNRFFKKKERGKFFETLPDLLPIIADLKSRYLKNLKRLKRMPVGLLHNDVSEKNIIVRNNDFSGFIDFSDCILLTPMANLAIAAAHLCFSNNHNWGEGLCSLITAYRRRFPFPHWKGKSSLFIFLMEYRLINEMATNFYLGLMKKARNTQSTNIRLYKKLKTLKAIPISELDRVIKNCN